MDEPRWSRVQELFHRLADLPPREQARALDAEEGLDPEHRRAVERLLGADRGDHSDLAKIVEGAAPLPSSIAEAMPGAGLGDGPAGVGLAEGDLLGPYRVVRELGRGGMGAVYLAERDDREYRARVAVKVIQEAAVGPGAIRRFREERQILAGLEHPNIARLLDGGTTPEGLPWLALEYVDGRPVHRHCDDLRLSVRARIALFLQVCGAVEYAHRKLVVHRDLKPGNVLVTDEGIPKLLDFGIARLLEPEPSGPSGKGELGAAGGDGGVAPPTATLVRILTPAYASPEQVRGERSTTATDVYAMGLLLYELLAGRPAQRPTSLTPAELEREVCVRDPPRPSAVVDPETATVRGTTPGRLARELAGDLDTIVLKALRKEPEERYLSVGALAQDLTRYLEGRPVLAQPTPWTRRAGKFVLRNRGAVASSVLFLLLVLGFGIVSSYQAVQLQRERDQARVEQERAEAVAAFMTDVFRASDPAESLGADVTARELLDRGAQRIRSDVGVDPRVRISLLGLMGSTYAGFALTEDALPLLREAAAQARLQWTPPHLETARTDRELGNVLMGRGELGEAGELLEGSWGQLQELPEVPVLERALTAAVLARHREVRGEWVEAEELFEEALALARSDPQAQEELELSVLTNLGQLADARGGYSEAEAYHREVLELREARLDALHPDVLSSLNNLALSLTSQGRFQEAERYFVELLERSEQVFGASPRFAVHLSNVASFHKNRGDPLTAEPLQRQALEIALESLGPDHREVAVFTNNLANLLHDLGREGEAAELHRESLAMHERIFGADHEQVANALVNLAAALRDLGELEEAVAHYRRGLEMDRRVLGDVHPYVVQDRINLAEALRLQGAFAAARAQLDSADSAAETGAEQGMDAGPMLRAEARLVSGRVRIAEGSREAGLGELRAALEILRLAQPDGGSQRAWAEVVLGAYLLEGGGLGVEARDEAEALLHSGHAQLLEAQGPHSPRVRQAERWLQAAGREGG